jgi:ABC-type proline/glycine betaine transport system ATPase subunit
MSEALLLANRIAVLEAGRLVQLGTPASLLRAPATQGVRDFLRAPRRQAARLEALLGEAEPR